MRHPASLNWAFYLEDATTPPPDPEPAVDAPTDEAATDDAPPSDATDDGEGDDDVTDATDEELDTLEAQLSDEFSALYDAGNPDAATTARMAEIGADIKKIRAERDRREVERAEQQRIADELKSEILPPPASEGADEAAATAAEEVAIAAAATPPAPAAPVQGKPKRRGLTASLSRVGSYAPPVVIDTDSRTSDLAMVAAAEVAGVVDRGAPISDMTVLASAAAERARVLGDKSGRVAVAQIKRTFDHNIDSSMSAGQAMAVMREAANPANLLTDDGALVASGGWCAPNVPLFNFFNIAAEDGLLDLPTVGIERGGIQWPVSPTLADFLGDPNVWNWTETDDQAAATGSPTKPCVQVPCPDTDDARLEADGICVTAGFLQEAAWPELVANHLSLTMSAHVHVINRSHILQIAALSTGVTAAEDGDGAIAPLLSAINVQAIDYREKFGMEEDAVLEVVLPRWIVGALQDDGAYRPGVENMLAITKAEIQAWLASRNVRAQFVADWQTRGSGLPGGDTALTSYPNSVQFLLYAAGTFVRGNGAKIDLGVIRDSALNATNDYTAAWSEEATLIAMIGHESRLVTVDICGHGQVGAGVEIACA